MYCRKLLQNTPQNNLLPSLPLSVISHLKTTTAFMLSSQETKAALTHHVVETLWCKLPWHFLYCFFKNREGLLWMKQINKKKKVGDVCIRDQRETGAGVNSHSSPAAGALTQWIHSVELGVAGSLVHTELSRKGLSSVSQLLRRLERRHIFTLACIESRSSDSPQSSSHFKWWKEELELLYYWGECCG